MPQTVTDRESLKTFIRDRARATWDERRSPYYLSFVAIELKKLGVDYRKLVGPLKLSQWAASTDIPETRLVTHPSQTAKIGFVPSDSGFEFDNVESNISPDSQVENKYSKGRALIKFVESLSELPNDAVVGLSIPAKTLVALLKH